jgi:hypothetical protein
MAVTDLSRGNLLQLAPVSFELRLSQGVDALGDRRFVGSVCARQAAEQHPGSAERHCAHNRQVTT